MFWLICFQFLLVTASFTAQFFSQFFFFYYFYTDVFIRALWQLYEYDKKNQLEYQLNLDACSRMVCVGKRLRIMSSFFYLCALIFFMRTIGHFKHQYELQNFDGSKQYLNPRPHDHVSDALQLFYQAL